MGKQDRVFGVVPREGRAPSLKVRRALCVGCVAVGCIVALHGVRVGASWSTACYPINNCDGLTFAVAGELLRDGGSPYSRAQRMEQVARTRLGHAPPLDLPFQYPPNAFPVFAARNYFRPEVGAYLWTAVTTLLFQLALVALSWRRLDERPLLPTAISANGLIWFNAFLTQTGALIGALGASLYALWLTRPFAAGLVLGVLALKPQYAFPLALLAAIRRDWRVLAGTVTSFTLLASASMAVYGAEHWPAFVRSLTEPNWTTPYMVSWPGLVARVAPAFVMSPPAAMAAYAGALLVAELLLCRDRDAPVENQLTVVISVSLLVSPNTHPYDLLLLVPGLVLLVTARGFTIPVAAFALVSWFGITPPRRWLCSLGTLVVAIWAMRAAYCRQGRVPDDRLGRPANGATTR